MADQDHTPPRRRRQKGRYSPGPARALEPDNSELNEATRSINHMPKDNSQLDYGLNVAHTHGAADSEAAKVLLYTLITSCGDDVDKLAVQRLKAHGELLRHYQQVDNENPDVEVFKKAHEAFLDVLRRFPWHTRTRNKFKSFEVIEAALELVAPFVKGNYVNDAKRMFQLCEEKTLACFGDDEERTIWVFISKGLVYQKHTTWNDAKLWFQRALSAAMENYSEDDGIRISLEEAMEVKNFSYVNDEGRPYRTIFGVGGLKIAPMRLHME